MKKTCRVNLPHVGKNLLRLTAVSSVPRMSLTRSGCSGTVADFLAR